jgi:hypothetical protein
MRSLVLHRLTLTTTPPLASRSPPDNRFRRCASDSAATKLQNVKPRRERLWVAQRFLVHQPPYRIFFDATMSHFGPFLIVKMQPPPAKIMIIKMQTIMVYG